MSKQLRQQLRELHGLNDCINADELWIKENKAKLMAQIKNTVRTEDTQGVFSLSAIEKFFAIFMPAKAVALARPFFVVCLALGATVGGWVAGVSASENSLPGDTLYGVKLATEKTQVTLAAVAGNKEGEAQLHLKFAGRRSQEVKKVIEAREPDAGERAGEALDNMKKSIESAKQNVQDMGEKDVAKAVVLASDVSKMTTEINKDLTEAATVAKSEASIVKEVTETKEQMTTASLETIQIVVEKTARVEDKTAGALQKQVSEIVAEKITTLKEDRQASMEVLKTLTAIPPTPVSVPSTTPVIASSTLLAPLTIPGPTIVSSTANAAARETVKDIVQKVDKSVELVDKMIGDAKVLVEQKNLVEAIEKAKQVNRASFETTKAVAEATETVKKILNEPLRPIENMPTMQEPVPSSRSTNSSSSR